MSQEVYEIVQKLYNRDIETKLAIQCSPVICGIKISNLLILSKNDWQMARNYLAQSHISYYVLVNAQSKISVLLYNKKMLEEYICKEDSKDFLVNMGYKDCSLLAVLREFAVRYQRYTAKMAPFPHEMGILLGYPIEDVWGFIENEGKNYLYTGYWKVYDNVNQKKELFEKYEESLEKIVRLMYYGHDMKDIIRMYSTNVV